MAEDTIEFFIESDGTITTKNGEISPLNHSSADQWLAHVKKRAGGKVTDTKLDKDHHHGTTPTQVKVGR